MLRAPRQSRSRASLERLVTAARDLLETRSFEELTVDEIVRRARSSVGVFYSRFPDKEALLSHLAELYAAEVIAAARAHVLARDWRAVPLAERVAGVVRFMVDFHRGRAGLIRALVIQARVRPRGRFAKETRRLNATLPSLLNVVLARRREIRHPDPERAAALGFFVALSAVRERVLFPDGPAAAADVSHAELVRELTGAWLACLRADRGA